MLKREKSKFTLALFAVVALLMLAEGSNFAQGQKPKRQTIQAQAMGESTQLGRNFAVTLIIEDYSTADDQKILVDAFNAKGSEGVYNALDKMKSKGRLAITGTLGFDVNYIRQFPNPDGSRRIRICANRPITFGEAWTDSRSSDFNLSGMEVILSTVKKKNTGTLYPAFKLTLDKEKQLQFELTRNPWKLVNVMVR